MRFPYDTGGGERRNQHECILSPGLYTTRSFSREDIFGFEATETNPNYNGLKNGNMDLYIMGQILYCDDLGNQRVTRFCRRYVRDKRRFFPVEDADYENVD